LPAYANYSFKATTQKLLQSHTSPMRDGVYTGHLKTSQECCRRGCGLCGKPQKAPQSI
jgi:hypothetical protein